MASKLIEKVGMSKAFLTHAETAINQAREFAGTENIDQVLMTYLVAFNKINATLAVFLKTIEDLEKSSPVDPDGEAVNHIEGLALRGGMDQ